MTDKDNTPCYVALDQNGKIRGAQVIQDNLRLPTAAVVADWILHGLRIEIRTVAEVRVADWGWKDVLDEDELPRTLVTVYCHAPGEPYLDYHFEGDIALFDEYIEQEGV